MPGGVVFLVCIPTLNYEQQLVFGIPSKPIKKIERDKGKTAGTTKVDLRLKETKTRTQLLTIENDHNGKANDNDDDDDEYEIGTGKRGYRTQSKMPMSFVSMEMVRHINTMFKYTEKKKKKIEKFTHTFIRIS